MFNPHAGLKAIISTPSILNDSLKKYRTAYIGVCIKVVDIKGEIDLYQVKLDPRLTVKKYNIPAPLPANYTYADDNYYIGGYWTTVEKS